VEKHVLLLKGFEVLLLELWVAALEHLRIQGLGFRVQGMGFRVKVAAQGLILMA